MNVQDFPVGKLPGSVLMSNEQYHSDTTRISKSGITRISKSPAHYYAKYLDPARLVDDSTPAKETGKIIHSALLEAEIFDSEYCVVPDDAPRKPTTTQRNAKKPSDETVAAIVWWDNFNAKMGNKQLCSNENWDLSHRIQDSVYKHPAARSLLTGIVTEQTFLFTDPTTGAPCKIRPDAYNTELRLLLDIKTTTDASYSGFGREAAKYQYDVQEAIYTDGFALCSDHRPAGFVFIAVEKEPPYAVGCYNGNEKSYHSGFIQYKKHLATYVRCRNANIWPAYSEQVLPLYLPDYHVDRIAREANDLQEF